MYAIIIEKSANEIYNYHKKENAVIYMKIVNLDACTTNPGDLSWDFLKKYSDDVMIYDRTQASDVIERAKGAEILVINKTVITADMIDALSPELKYICLQSTGYNVVDIDAARNKGISVCNIPSYSTNAVAQEVFAFILHFSNQTDLHSDSVHNGDWCSCPDFCYWKAPLFELDGKTIGIIGFGSIGKKVAHIAESFGMNVIFNSRSAKDTSDFKTAKQVDIEFLLKNSDFVSCHCPLTDKTTNLINKATLNKMKKSAILINTSRGPVVDEQALADALNSDVIAGAALDVLKEEPANPSNPLLKAKNCVITPHIAWAAKETRQRLLDILDKNIQSCVNGNPQNKVN